MKEADLITYLSGASNNDGGFINLKEVPVEIFKKHERLLVFKLKLILMSRPEEIFDLYNLEIDYIDNLIRRELNQNLNLLIEAGIKAAGRGNLDEDMMVIVFLVGFLDNENQLIFKHILEKKMKEKNVLIHMLFLKITNIGLGGLFESNRDDPEPEFVLFIKPINQMLIIDDSIN